MGSLEKARVTAYTTAHPLSQLRIETVGDSISGVLAVVMLAYVPDIYTTRNVIAPEVRTP